MQIPDQYVIIDNVVMPKAVALNIPTNRASCPAAKYLNPESVSYYRLSVRQITILPSEHADLNDDGRAALQAARDQPKLKTLNGATIVPASSGCWMPDPTSVHYKETDGGYICGWENRQLLGPVREDGQRLQTSTIRFFELNPDKKSGWAVTESGTGYTFTL